ncbi:MAG: alpha/beta hydrolase [Chloroflexi bacterium]|nr:alpha/beta hydrolase [Chloroflexota bacterium]
MNAQTDTSTKTGLGCLGRSLRIIGVLLVLLALLGVAGAIYETQAEKRVATQFPPPGQLVYANGVNGRQLHIHCIGEGSPTIILDAGQGGWSSDWADIMPALSENNRVCAYDRAGYGWSDAVEDVRSPQDAANNLADLLTAAEIEPPYILVGFSHAGLADRIFASQHADQMAGMVLIDPATEFDNEIMGAALRQQQQAATGMFKGGGFMAKIGLLRLIGTQNMAESAPFIGTDPANPEVYYAFISDPQWWQTSAQEFASGLDDDHLAMVRDQGQIEDIPLVIIGSDVLDTTGNAAMDGLQSARHDKLSTLAAQSTQGEFIIAKGSTHNILTDRPDVVVDAIKSMVTAR